MTFFKKRQEMGEGKRVVNCWWTILVLKPDYLADFGDSDKVCITHEKAISAQEAVVAARLRLMKEDEIRFGEPFEEMDYLVLATFKGRVFDKTPEDFR